MAKSQEQQPAQGSGNPPGRGSAEQGRGQEAQMEGKAGERRGESESRLAKSGREQALSRGGSGFGASNPFSIMRRMFDDMDRMFEELSPFRALTPWSSGAGPLRFDDSLWAPDIEVSSQNGTILVRADLPGTTERDVRVSIEDDVLTIEGERREEQEERRGGVLFSERTYGKFRRSLQLPPGVDPESAEADFHDGVLEIRLKAPAASRGKQIQIRSQSGEPKHPSQKSEEQAASAGSDPNAPRKQ